MHKIGFGPKCDFIYDQGTNKLITLSAQLGYAKCKNFNEIEGKDAATQFMIDHHEPGAAIKAMAEMLSLHDVYKQNFGITLKDGQEAKPKILDFLIGMGEGRLPARNTHLKDHEKDYIKKYAKDWGENDDLSTYMKRQFKTTFNDPKFQELFQVMPEDDKKLLDTYCQQIVEMGVKDFKKIKVKASKQPISNQVKVKKVVKTDNVKEFTNVLTNVRRKNKDFKQFTANTLMSIFDAACTKGYYTNKEPKLPLSEENGTRNDDEAKLMRKFSVAFQIECRAQGLNFSNKSGINKHGMRAKSAIDYIGSKEKMEEAVEEVWR